MRTATLKPDRRAPTVELRFPKGEKHRGRPLIDFLRKHLSGSIWWNGDAWETNGIGVSPEALLVRWGFTLTAPFESGVTPVSKLSTNRRHVLVRPMLVGRAACQEMLGLSATWDAKRGLFLLPIADICPNGNTPISGVRFSAEAIELARRRHTHTSAPSARLQEALVHASTATSPKDLSRADRDVMVAAVGRLPDWFGIDLFGYQKVGAMAVACGRRLLADEPGIGKCLDGRTLVEVDGDLIRIADLWNQNSAGAYPDQENPDFAELVDVQDKHYQVPSLSTPSGQQTNATVSHLYRQRYDGQMIRIQTRSGRRITCTPQHRFWTSEGWLQAGELSAGSWLSSRGASDQAEQTDGHCSALELAMVRVLAWQIAEGADTHAGSTLDNTDRQALERLRRDFMFICDELSLTSRPTKAQIRSSPHVEGHRPIWKLTLNSRNWIRYQKNNLGIPHGLRSAERFVPHFIMTGPVLLQREFLRHYFAGEAFVSRNAIEVSSASQLLIQQVQLMLSRLGITMNSKATWKWATNGTGIKRQYWRGVIAGQDWDRFASQIGIADGEKADLMHTLAQTPHSESVVNHRSPCMATLRRIESAGVPARRLGPGLRSKPRMAASRQSADESLEILRRIESGELLRAVKEEANGRWKEATIRALSELDGAVLADCIDRMEALCAPGVDWDEVQEVETVHHSGYIYDLVVPETHCYVASGLYTHNTYQSIAAAVLMGASRILVVSPPLAITNWLRELERCGVVAADSTARNFALKVPDKTRKRWVTPPPCRADRPVAVVVSDSLLAQRDGLAPTLTEWSPDVVIWDEAHRGKTYGSKRSEAVLQLTHDCSAAGIAVTGTPMLKSPAELAPLMEFTGQDVSVFGGLRQLLDHTCTLDRYGRLRPSRKGEDWLQERLTGQVMIRRTKKQVSPQLPAKHRYPIYVDAPMASFNKAHKEVNQKIDQWLTQHGAFPDDETILDYASGNLGYISQLRKAAGVCKVPVAEEMIAQHIEQTRTSSGVYSDPLIVWTHHKEVTEALAERVPSIDGAAMIIGGMSRARRDQLIDEFQAGHVGALICSTHAAGVAITLTRCHTMLFVETDWTPGIVVQAEDRAHRTGQTAEQVSIGTLVCKETLDPIVQATLHRKAQFLDATIGGDNSVYVDEDDELTATDVLVNLVQARRETLGA
ncbi:hypothetical protein F8O06_05230 [Pseudoclavibacter sp. CFCC 14310]|uniref:SNF2-related protein n=1 Tax=Pseudoclavibacter sp. CFCC 14310 TaxID=2615180 RepID=UPI001301210E|nr:SNF2-related protein [Pseudoclavibacter sp. CFCC 14310]KAB1646168.1 hypothetical protein F8O06_05230 [Pseudoclavibacter sp. CFCC 14310]